VAGRFKIEQINGAIMTQPAKTVRKAKPGAATAARGKRRGQARGGPAQGPPVARLFFAVFVPNEAKAALEGAQKKLLGKWWKKVHPDQFHLTLFFIGAWKKGAADKLGQTARKAALGIPTFSAKLRGTGFHPNEGTPRVWFVKAEGEHFELLASRLAAELAKQSNRTAEETEAFKSHITLARKKGSSPRPPPIVLDLEFAVTKFALVKSTLTAAGPGYQILEEFLLEPALPTTSPPSDIPDSTPTSKPTSTPASNSESSTQTEEQ
jgi:RNA 2',3'-cyclic 3'-phosphodiesterase